MGSTASRTLDNKGAIYFKRGEYKEALDNFDLALEYSPKSPTILWHKAVCLYAIGRPFEAEKFFDMALEIDPVDVQCLSNKSQMLLALKRYEEAKRTLELALSLQPTNISLLTTFGDCLYQMEQIEEALKPLNKCLAIKPTHSRALHIRAHVNQCLAHVDECLADFKSSYENESKEEMIGSTLKCYAQALKSFGRIEQSIECFQVCLDQLKSTNELERALILYELTRYKESLMIFENLIKIKPITDHLFYLNYALCLNRSGECEKSLEMLDKSLTLLNDPNVLVRKAKILFQLKRIDQAQLIIDQALKLTPDHRLGNCIKGLIELDRWTSMSLNELEQHQQVILSFIDRSLSGHYHHKRFYKAKAIVLLKFERFQPVIDLLLYAFELQIATHSWRCHSLLSQAYQQLNEITLAEKHHQLAENYRQLKFIEIQSKTFQQQLNFVDSLRYCQLMLILSPNNLQTLLLKAQLLFQLNQTSQALSVIDRILSIQVDFQPAIELQSQILQSIQTSGQSAPFLVV